MTLRAKVATVAAEKNPIPVKRGRLAEDYDGIGEFVAVSMSLGSTSAALAKIAPGAATTGQSIPAGTQVAVVSQQGHLEVVSMGSKVATGYSLLAGENNELEATIEPVNLTTPNLLDYGGNAFVSSSGFEGGWSKLIQSGGLYNPDFELSPTELNVDISEDNQIPYWNELVTVGTGAHVQVVDSQDAFGQVLRCSLDSGSSSGAYFWVGQIIPRTDLTGVAVTFRYSDNGDNVILDIVLDWLDVDGSWLRRDGSGVVIGDLDLAAPDRIDYYQAITDKPPTDAAFLKVWIGLRHSSGSAAAEFDILSVKLTNPPFIVTGSETFDLINEEYQEHVVYFYPPFPWKPEVVLATVSAATNLYFATVNSITSTSFNLRVIHRDGTVRTASPTVNWMALAYQRLEY